MLPSLPRSFASLLPVPGPVDHLGPADGTQERHGILPGHEPPLQLIQQSGHRVQHGNTSTCSAKAYQRKTIHYADRRHGEARAKPVPAFLRAPPCLRPVVDQARKSRWESADSAGTPPASFFSWASCCSGSSSWAPRPPCRSLVWMLLGFRDHPHGGLILQRAGRPRPASWRSPAGSAH